MHTKLRALLISFVGIALIILTLLSDQLASVLLPAPEVTPSKIVIESDGNRGYGVSGWILPDYTIDYVEVQYTVMYESRMKVNQTKILKLTFDRKFHWLAEKPEPGEEAYETYLEASRNRDREKVMEILKNRKPAILRPQLKNLIEIHLNSSGFEISPSTRQTISKSNNLPAELRWTITPKSEGEHLLLLKLPEAHELAPDYLISKLCYTLNGISQAVGDTSFYELPLTVGTAWGVSKTVEDSVRAFLALIGFILLYPLFLDFWKRRWG